MNGQSSTLEFLVGALLLQENYIELRRTGIFCFVNYHPFGFSTCFVVYSTSLHVKETTVFYMLRVCTKLYIYVCIGGYQYPNVY